MSRLLYEHSLSYKGHLIIPYIFSQANFQDIYSYKLLSEDGRKGKFERHDNPAGLYSSDLGQILQIAQDNLDKHSDIVNNCDYFKWRYTYGNHLIIVHEMSGKYYYDHYKPNSLNNIAAPKLFVSEYDCIMWVKQGLEKNSTQSSGVKA